MRGSFFWAFGPKKCVGGAFGPLGGGSFFPFRMGSALARNRGEDESDVIRHLTQRVAVVLAKLNASMLLNRSPQTTPAHIDGIE